MIAYRFYQLFILSPDDKNVESFLKIFSGTFNFNGRVIENKDEIIGTFTFLMDEFMKNKMNVVDFSLENTGKMEEIKIRVHYDDVYGHHNELIKIYRTNNELGFVLLESS